MADTTDELVSRASRGDAGAVESLLARYTPDVERFLRARAGAMILAKESGSDLVQSVCRELLEDLRRGRFAYQGDAQFKQWLFGAAELKLKERGRFWRQEKRDVRREAVPATNAAGASAADAPSREFAESLARSAFTPSGEVARRDEVERLAAAFARLKAEEQAVIRWFHVEGLSHSEIAAREHIQESHSRTWLARAMARLATLARGAA